MFPVYLGSLEIMTRDFIQISLFYMNYAKQASKYDNSYLGLMIMKVKYKVTTTSDTAAVIAAAATAAAAAAAIDAAVDAVSMQAFEMACHLRSLLLGTSEFPTSFFYFER